MIGESSGTSTLTPPQTKTSVLITLGTPGAETPICRLGNSEDVVKGLTVRQLIERVVSPNSLFSVGVPINQLQAESSTALAISELLKASCCEVTAPGKGASPHRSVSLDELARDVAREQVGTQGNRFLNINLDIRSASDISAPGGDERRHAFAPATAEVEQKRPVVTGTVVEAEPRSAPPARPIDAPVERKPLSPFRPAAGPPAPPVREIAASEVTPAAGEPSIAEPAAPKTVAPGEYVFSRETPEQDKPDDASAKTVETRPAAVASDLAETTAEEPPAEKQAAPEAAPAPKPAGPEKILTIMAEKLKDEPQAPVRDRKEYARKADWLRAQFLPEVESLDFSGLFVGNLGLGIREEKARRSVVLADPARITEVLLRANGYRRSADHPKALICYQELVDMDPSNSDFRFLLGKTLVELGQREQALDAFMRAKELGHDGAERELSDLKRAGHRPKAALGFLKFWKQ